MLHRFALRDRLALTFALALVSIYAVFAVVLLLVIDRSVDATADHQLHTVADAVSVFIDVGHDGKFHPDAHDREQFATISSDVSGAALFDADGNTVISTATHLPDFVAAARARTGSTAPTTVTVDGHTIRVCAETFTARRTARRSARGTVVAWQTYDIVGGIRRKLTAASLGFGVVIAVLGYLIGAQITRRGLAPLTRMSRIIEDIEAHDLSERVGSQPHDDELGRLAATFDRMLDRLEAAFGRQKQFTADASHDLRAPLATLRAEIDLALRRERTPEEYRTALASMAQDADRLDELIDALLAAARSELGGIALTTTDLSQVAQQSVDRIAAFAHAKHITIDASLGTQAHIAADPVMLERAVLAVLHNAVKFTPDHATIHVSVCANEASAQLRIQDAGPGFSDAALSHAFDRFWRDDTARGRGGSGLGLAIAKTIVDRFGGSVSLANDAAGGGAVEAIFPRVS